MSEFETRTQMVLDGDHFILPILLMPGEDGYLVASCPILPGCFSQGRTREEALANVVQAARLTLACREEEGWEVPTGYVLAQVEVPI